MPEIYSLPEIYDEACDIAGDEPFTEWFSGKDLRPGQVCEAAVWYEKTDRWALEESEFDPRDEENATWFAKKVRSGKLPPPSKYVKFYFDLEDGELLLAVHGKYRPVILVKKFESQWVNPLAEPVSAWMVLPLFSYKQKHTQIILIDARLDTPQRFYIPARKGRLPGAAEECAVRFLTMQAVQEAFLEPVKAMDPGQKMSRPYGLTQTALKLVMYHFFKNLALFHELTQQKDRYDLFKEYVQELIQKGLSANTDTTI